MSRLNVWVPFYNDLDQLEAMVETVPPESHVYAVDGRHATFEGDHDLTPGARAWCAQNGNVTYCAPSDDRLPWGHDYDEPALRGPQHEKAAYANYEVLPQGEWALKLDTDERIAAFDIDYLDNLDRAQKYSPPIDVLMWRGYHPCRLYVPEHWTFWLADQFFHRDFYPRDTPVEELYRATAQTNHAAANVGGFVPKAYIRNVGHEREEDYQQRRGQQLHAIGRERRAEQYREGLPEGEIGEFGHVNEQVRRLYETDWQVLIVLDGQRWDHWRQVSTGGEPVESPAVCTHLWTQRIGRYLDFGGVLGILSNPVAATHMPPTLTRVDECWDLAREINGIPAIDPYDVTRRVLDAVERGAERIYAHYPTPHGPYPWVTPAIPVFTPEFDAHHVDELEDRNLFAKYIDDDEHWLTAEHLIAGYRENVHRSFEAIKPVIRQCENVVVTADHGELLGEEVNGQPVYGHKPTFGRHVHLVTVPWWEVGFDA